MWRAVISPYRGFGRGNELLLRGRVLAEKPITRARERETVWRNLVNSYRRFESDELAGVAVRGSYRDALMETVSDREGYFQIRLQPIAIDPELLWQEVSLGLSAYKVFSKGQVLVPTPAAKFAVVSDIDDTIVQTGATKLLTMIRSGRGDHRGGAVCGCGDALCPRLERGHRTCGAARSSLGEPAVPAAVVERLARRPW